MSTIQILTPTEIKNYESPPHFDSFSRKKFFALPIVLMKEVENLRASSGKIAFILQAGYFRSSNRFFGNRFFEADIAFVAGRLSLPNPGSLEIPKQNLARNRKIIAQFYGFRSLTKIDKEQLILEIADSVKQLTRPAEVFRQTIKNLNSHKFILPGYDFLSTNISRELYRRNQDKLHTSSDGQKYGVSVPSLNANYSFKYFGQEKGVSVYSFIDERNLLFYSTVISSSEREAAYVIDGLLHNEAVKSDIHSTDSHGFTEVVFAVTHLLGFTFAPRLKTLCKHQLYSFEKKKIYANKGCVILPDAYINTKIIEDNWDSILRFVATIKLKRTTASQLFKRLNSYSNQHPLYQALKEFGKIIKTLFILRYVDDLDLRQSIEKQLSKIEQSQKFAKAIAFGNNQEFSEGDKQMQDIIANCRRLIENTVICWNYLYLTQKLTELNNQNEKQELIETFKDSSIITWQHINFHGEYDFSEEKTRDSIRFDLPKILSWKLEENGK